MLERSTGLSVDPIVRSYPFMPRVRKVRYFKM